MPRQSPSRIDADGPAKHLEPDESPSLGAAAAQRLPPAAGDRRGAKLQRIGETVSGLRRGGSDDSLMRHKVNWKILGNISDITVVTV